jgi:iron complex outermembrane receptor protein
VIRFAGFLAFVVLIAPLSMPAQDTSAVVIRPMITVGTRAPDRSSTRSPVPVDVITAELIEASGLTETWQILQRLVPALNVPHFPRGDDGMRPITLRGLSPGHVLVLVNGKRLHGSPLILAGPVLSGTAPNDIGSIPSGAIERIEILRDGAGAQYGSDAIAGVLNIILKSSRRVDARTSIGETYSSEGGRDWRDGKLANVSGTYGLRLPRAGYATLSAEFRDRGSTNRAYPDARQQYFAGDPRNDDPPVITNREGDGESRDAGVFLNASRPFKTGPELYAFGGFMHRNARSAGSFRRAMDARNTVRAIHPNGFLPIQERTITDYSGAAGVRGIVRGLRWDLSSVLGSSRVRFDVHDSNNATLGAESPRDFYIGALSAHQWTNNFDLSRSITIAQRIPLNIAAGTELRWDRYNIEDGDPASYLDGGVPILDGDSAGLPATIGSQAVLGFRPEDEVTATRNTIAAYLDLESSITRKLLVDVAGRAERYSDHGSAADGKIAARLSLFRGIAIRGSAGSGSRAPSLSQSYLASTRTVLVSIGGRTSAFVIRTLPVHTQAAKLLGARPLEPETSLNFSGGIIADIPRLPVITADFYAVDVDDRIVRSAEFRDPSVRRLLEQNGIQGVAGGQYFANAIDTRTRGLDIVANYGIIVGRNGVLRVTGGYNQTRTRVTHIAEVPPELRNFQSLLFGRAQEGAVEAGQPDRTVTFTADYSVNRFGVNLHNQRFGQASLLDSDDPASDQTVRAKWITDAGATYRLSPHFRISANAANLFDVYPTEWIDFKDGVNAKGMSVAGNFRYPGGISPFGMNGRTVYLHLSYRR